MLQKIFLRMRAHERHFSAFAMVAGFVVDNLFFARIDLWQTHGAFVAYTLICLLAIPLLHWVETNAEQKGIAPPRWSVVLPLAIQFALGGFWSGFVIFYGRSAVLGTSWPFLVFLVLIFLGSEYFHQYHARLVFTSVLFFFALYSYAIFAVPVVTGTIGTLTFLESGAVAISIFGLFTILLRFLAHERFRLDVWRIRAGAFSVLVLMNVFYFTNILPPLPLSAEEGGIYHLVWHVPGAYMAMTEPQSRWVRYLGFSPTLHVDDGEVLYAYSSVFAPTALDTTILHRWQWYDPVQKEWDTKAVVAYPIIGGRDGGYRGYSKAFASEVGLWRVTVETKDGRAIDRLSFIVKQAETPPSITAVLLK